MYKDLFLDFDDTLYDTRGNAQIALGELYDHFGWSEFFVSPNDFYRPYWETNSLLWEQYAAGEIERDYLIVERFRRPLTEGRHADGTPLCLSAEECRRVSDVFLDYCSNKPGLIDGALDLMRYLKERGYRIHMCSNGFHEVQYKKLRSCGLLSYFDTIVLSEDAGANKPSAKFFDYAMAQTGATKQSAIMIGDNPTTDIKGAQAYGLDTIFFDRKGTGMALSPTYVVKALGDIKTIL